MRRLISWLLVAMLILGTFSALASLPSQFTGLYFLVLPLLVSSLVLRPAQVRVVLVVILVGLGIELRGMRTFRDLQSAIERVADREEC